MGHYNVDKSNRRLYP